MAAGILAHDHDVDLVQQVRPHDTGVPQCRYGLDGRQLAVEVEPRPKIVDETAAPGAAEYRASVLEHPVAEIGDLARQRRAVLPHRLGADRAAHADLETMAGAPLDGADRGQAGLDDFGPHPLSRKNTDE
jgi:hypothetical protein